MTNRELIEKLCGALEEMVCSSTGQRVAMGDGQTYLISAPSAPALRAAYATLTEAREWMEKNDE